MIKFDLFDIIGTFYILLYCIKDWEGVSHIWL